MGYLRRVDLERPGYIWPLYDLIIATPRLTLKLPLVNELAALARVARDIRDPIWLDTEPWASQPSPQLERGVMQYYWKHQAEWTPDNWRLLFAVFSNEDGRIIGEQSIQAQDFRHTRKAATGSWLGHEYQGQGYGTEMRQAVATLGFFYLGAQHMESDYWPLNHASRRVSEKLGYSELPQRFEKYGEKDVGWKCYVDLTRFGWVQPDYEIFVEGFEPCREMFGI